MVQSSLYGFFKTLRLYVINYVIWSLQGICLYLDLCFVAVRHLLFHFTCTQRILRNHHTVFTEFVMTYLITLASYWLKFVFKFLCRLTPRIEKRGNEGAYIRNKLSHITFKWLKSVLNAKTRYRTIVVLKVKLSVLWVIQYKQYEIV